MTTIMTVMLRERSSGNYLTIESEYVGEDAQYLYLASGKYFKKEILSLSSKIVEEGGDDATTASDQGQQTEEKVSG